MMTELQPKFIVLLFIWIIDICARLWRWANPRYFWNVYIRAPILGPYWRWKQLTFYCTAGYECDWVHPYGFVPEAGCPIHDNDQKI